MEKVQTVELQAVEKSFKSIMEMFIKANTTFKPCEVGTAVNGLWSDIVGPITNK